MGRYKKLGLSAVTVAVVMCGLVSPAAATDNPVVTTAGTLTTVFGSMPLLREEGPCPEKPGTRVFTTDADGTWSLTGVFSVQFQMPPGSGNWYQADRTILMGSGGTWSGSAPTQALTGLIAVQQRIYQLKLTSGPLTCEKTNLRCIVTGVFQLQATSTYRALAGPGLPTTAPGDEVYIDAFTPIGTPLYVSSCTAPWNSVGGTHASISGFTSTLV